MAHPVRPASYVEINNFYTMTVYNKGAELIRMQQTLLGKEVFKRTGEIWEQKGRESEPPFFGRLSTSLPLCPETSSLKTRVPTNRQVRRSSISSTSTLADWRGTRFRFDIACAFHD